MSTKAFIARHPVSACVALTFAISWGGVLLVIGGPGAIPGSAAQESPLFPFVYLAMLAGPSVAGVALTGLIHGKAGLRALLSQLIKWRVAARWYAVALLTAPLLLTATLLALSPFSPAFLPGLLTSSDKASLLLFGIAVGLGAGVFEELGWTGFAVPGLRRRYGVLSTGLIVGLVWGAWHFLVVAWGIGTASGAVPLTLFLPLDLLSFLPAYRVFMVWVFDRTGSLFVAMLAHASLTTSMLVLGPPVTGAPLLAYQMAIAAVLWVAMAAVGMANRRSHSPHRLRTRAA